MIKKQRPNRSNLFIDLSMIFLPVFYISIVPLLINMIQEYYKYSSRLYVCVQSIFSFMLGCFLLYIGIYSFQRKNKRTIFCLILGLAFCILHNLCFFMFLFLSIRIPYLHPLIRNGDMKLCFTIIGFYSILLLIKKMNNCRQINSV